MYWTFFDEMIQNAVLGRLSQESHFSLIHSGWFQQTYLMSRQSNTWASKLAWQYISSTVESGSLLYEQTSHRSGRWWGRTSWASKTGGETPRSCTTCVSQLSENVEKNPCNQAGLRYEENNCSKGTLGTSCSNSCLGNIPYEERQHS